MPSEGPETTCVVLLREGTILDDVARRRLAERDWRLEVRHDPLTTMAELCLRQRRARGQGASGPSQTTVLLVRDPNGWVPARQLVEATRRYLPEILVLASTDLDEALEVPVAAPPAEDAVSASPAGPPEPAEPAEPTDVDAPARDAPADDSTRITRAEIDMLLQPPGEP